ncbi:hypothetical protein [Mesorhizobium sp. DCY119]|uniref:hypothetical protein n=1 Tax=Mesorhizobium sp. DCY119 TaxID=2108445 RepID=UPI000E71B844|nr:hypothetical protein [Mesorhizobium sp. DCY119]RJG40824.1 hypothetical protein D3Y55_26700 [Mesorhizobium sp. DCY119]
MLFAYVNGVKRAPLVKGERTLCDCGGTLTAVLPIQNVPHWRHLSGDCDPWSEPEGPWHLWWKSQFSLQECEIPLIDNDTGERHRADVLVDRTVVELQHSSIGDDERAARERFYSTDHRMFWLLDVEDKNSFRGISFGMSMDFQSRPVTVGSTQFHIMRWHGRSSQFIEKWKRSSVHVFLHYRRTIYYLATWVSCADLVRSLKKGEYALVALSEVDFVKAVRT